MYFLDMRWSLFIPLLSALIFVTCVRSIDPALKAQLDKILNDGVTDRVYTGVAAMAGSLDGSFQYSGAFGRYKYPDDPDDDGIEDAPVELSSRFDLASCSKVVGGTSAIALLYERGYISLDMRVVDILGEEFAKNGKGSVLIRHCLLHNAGFAPDPVPWYWNTTFGCPNTFDDFPAEDFSCLDKIYESFLAESLVTPPGEAFKYSDLSFITLSVVAGTVAMQRALVEKSDFSPTCLANGTSSYLANVLCHYEAFLNKNVFRFEPSSKSSNIMMPTTSFLVPQELWTACVPTINDTGNGSYTHKRIQGQVSDGNTYAMGGISGHAGVFSTVQDLANLAQNLLASLLNFRSDMYEKTLLNSSTMEIFTKIYNSTQSSRALGWDTNSFTVTDYGYSNACGNWSASTFMHVGYTGTMLCIDPELKMWSVLLSNRVYNCQGQACPNNMSEPVKVVERAFNNAIKESVEKMYLRRSTLNN